MTVVIEKLVDAKDLTLFNVVNLVAEGCWTLWYLTLDPDVLGVAGEGEACFWATSACLECFLDAGNGAE